MAYGHKTMRNKLNRLLLTCLLLVCPAFGQAPTGSGNKLHPTQDASDNNTMIGIPVTMGANAAGYTVDGTFSCANWYLAVGATPKMQCALYTSVSGAAAGGTKLCSSADATIPSNSSNATENWTYGVLTGCGPLSSTALYFIFFNNNNASNEPGYDNAGSTYCTGAGGAVFASSTYGTWPTTMPATSGTVCFDGVLKVTAVAGSTPKCNLIGGNGMIC